VVAALARRAPASAAQDELHFQQFLAANCFGDHVARAGIGVTARELGVLAQDVAAKIALLIFGVVLVVGFAAGAGFLLGRPEQAPAVTRR
jgi:hypothetical protein